MRDSLRQLTEIGNTAVRMPISRGVNRTKMSLNTLLATSANEAKTALEEAGLQQMHVVV